RETNFRTNNNKLKHTLIKKMYNDADLVVALSEGIRDNMIKLYNIEKENITTIYNPIDTKYIGKQSQESCEYNYSKELKLVACGRLVEQKNFSLLIKSLSILKERNYSNFELFI